jgi:hypothetical protein
MANNSVDLVGLDFSQIKANLKSYLKRSDSPFKDVDFEGSNISSFIDVLAYNTYLNNFYLNMVASEMFLDTAQLKDSVVSHAKELNYVPRSYTSAQAVVSFVVTPTTSLSSLVVPKGTSFTTRIGSNNFTFSTEELQVFNANTDGKFYVNTAIYEGSFLTESFTYTPANTAQRLILSNPTIDTSSLSVVVYENNGANSYIYTRASSFLGVEANSQVYFLQAAENDQYEIIFGDNVIGRKPAAGAVISTEYRVCSGAQPNGARTFDIDGSISGQSNISITTTINAATGGAVSEDIKSIKFNATKHYQNQERAVTVDDYESLLLRNFSDINAVSAFGGEDYDPPVYGKVFVSVDMKAGEVASAADKQRYYSFLKPRCSVSIDPVFVDPKYLYTEVYANVRYNTNVTTLKQNDIKTLVSSAVSSYNEANLDGFKKTLRYSKLVEDINSAHSSIISCDVYTSPFKIIAPISGEIFKEVLEFGIPLTTEFTISYDDIVRAPIPAVRTTVLEKDGKSCYVKDDGNGILGLYTLQGVESETLLSTVGTVDYNSGKVTFTNLNIDSYIPASGTHVHVYVVPVEKDISSLKNQILTIRDPDIQVEVVSLKI